MTFSVICYTAYMFAYYLFIQQLCVSPQFCLCPCPFSLFPLPLLTPMLWHQDSKTYSILQLLASGVRLLLTAFAYGPVDVNLTGRCFLALQCSVKNLLLYLVDTENPITLHLQNRYGFIVVKSCILFKIVKTFLGYTTENWLVTSYMRFQNTSHSDCYNKEIWELIV